VWQRHFYDGLQGALPSVVLPVAVDFAWARPPWAATVGPSHHRAAVSERLWDQIRTAHAGRGLDAVISYCFSSDVDPALIERTVELGIPWINFFCDSTYAFDFVEALARVSCAGLMPCTRLRCRRPAATPPSTRWDLSGHPPGTASFAWRSYGCSDVAPKCRARAGSLPTRHHRSRAQPDRVPTFAYAGA